MGNETNLAICLYLVLALVLCGGCSNNVSKERIAKDYEVVVIDSCEYVIMQADDMIRKVLGMYVS